MSYIYVTILLEIHYLQNIHVYNDDDCYMNVSQYRLQFAYYFFYQQTPLHIAAREGYVHTVRYLLDRQADKCIQDKETVSIYGNYTTNAV